MNNEIRYQSTSEVDEASGELKINFFANFEGDNFVKPSIYATKITDKDVSIDDIQARTGDLVVLANGDIVSEINQAGEMVITSSDEEATQYSKNVDSLEYNE